MGEWIPEPLPDGTEWISADRAFKEAWAVKDIDALLGLPATNAVVTGNGGRLAPSAPVRCGAPSRSPASAPVLNPDKLRSWRPNIAQAPRGSGMSETRGGGATGLTVAQVTGRRCGVPDSSWR